jgi:Zn-finger nucleic acid-binding protein
MQMTCPKCHGDMRTYERSGVTVDQCTECRGIFLDRGELEKLFEAEANWNDKQSASAPPQGARQAAGPPQPGYAPPPPPAYGAPGYGAPGYPPAAYAEPGYHGHYRQQGGYHGHYQRRRKKSFLNELFD